MSEANKATVREYVEAMAVQDWDKADSLHTGGWQQHNPDGTKITRDDFEAQTAAFFVGFPDLVPTIHDQVAEGDKVATHLTWSGTHTGEFAGIRATGNHADFEVVRIDRLEAGKIAETKVMFDTGATMRQLGVGM